MSMKPIDAEAVLAQMRSLAARAQGLESGVGGIAGTPGTETAGTQKVDFGDALKNAVDFVNEHQQQAGKLAQQFERGEPGVDLAEVMVAIQKASISFQAATQVRNRLVSAYQDIMNMPL